MQGDEKSWERASEHQLLESSGAGEHTRPPPELPVLPAAAPRAIRRRASKARTGFPSRFLALPPSPGLSAALTPSWVGWGFQRQGRFLRRPKKTTCGSHRKKWQNLQDPERLHSAANCSQTLIPAQLASHVTHMALPQPPPKGWRRSACSRSFLWGLDYEGRAYN